MSDECKHGDFLRINDPNRSDVRWCRKCGAIGICENGQTKHEWQSCLQNKEGTMLRIIYDFYRACSLFLTGHEATCQKADCPEIGLDLMKEAIKKAGKFEPQLKQIHYQVRETS